MCDGSAKACRVSVAMRYRRAGSALTRTEGPALPGRAFVARTMGRPSAPPPARLAPLSPQSKTMYIQGYGRVADHDTAPNRTRNQDGVA